jgi:hypothetical protein
MNYWIFKCNPELYRIDDRLNDPNPVITWKVSRYRDEIKDGDTAFIWKTGDDRGIVGAMRLQSDPQLMAEIPSELPYAIGGHAGGKEMMVIGELVARKTITVSELQDVQGLAGLSALHPPYQGTNFPATHEEGQLLMELLGLN